MDGLETSTEKRAASTSTTTCASTNTRLDAIEGFSEQWALALERTGICTTGDVLAADPDTLAYMLDGYEIAEHAIQLVKGYVKQLEARHAIKPAKAAPASDASTEDLPESHQNEAQISEKHDPGNDVPDITITDTPTAKTSDASVEMPHHTQRPAKNAPLSSTSSHTSARTPDTSDKSHAPHREHGMHTPESHSDMNFAAVLGAMTSASISEDRSAWLCRLDAMRLLIDNNGSEAQIAALLALDPCTQPDEDMRELIELDAGMYTKQMLEQCERVLALSIGPDGCIASGYARLVAQASSDARRVCTVLALARTGAIGSYDTNETTDTGMDAQRASVKQMYYRALADALHAAEECPLTNRLVEHVRSSVHITRAA